MNGNVYVDYVHHHVGSWDVPGYNGYDGYTPPASAHVQDRSDYPGFELSDPYVGAASFNPNYRISPAIAIRIRMRRRSTTATLRSININIVSRI
jgi:hypothetical protein